MKRKNILFSILRMAGMVLRPISHGLSCPARRRVVLQESPLAGFQYHRAASIWPFLRVGEHLHLKREPSNPHDRYAVAVWFKNEHLGYIPRRENRTLARLLDQGERLETTIVRLLEEENPWRKIRFRVEWLNSG
ncbi:MAG: HIRAN domain-containing protein [Candidatus Thiodiazotropha endolucinida]